MTQALHMAVLLLQVCLSSPFNMKACMTDQHIWLYPEIQRGWELYTDQELPYQRKTGRMTR